MEQLIAFSIALDIERYRVESGCIRFELPSIHLTKIRRNFSRLVPSFWEICLESAIERDWLWNCFTHTSQTIERSSQFNRFVIEPLHRAMQLCNTFVNAFRCIAFSFSHNSGKCYNVAKKISITLLIHSDRNYCWYSQFECQIHPYLFGK